MADNPSPASAAPVSSETKLWEGRSSQWIHFWYFALCALAAAGILFLSFKYSVWIMLALVVPAIMALSRWLMTRTTVYTLTNERLLITRGILDRHQDNLELYRVRDYAISQPIVLRMLGLGNLHLITSDTLTPNATIHAIHGVEDVREKLRSAVEAARGKKGVRQMDVDSIDGGIAGDLPGDGGHRG